MCVCVLNVIAQVFLPVNHIQPKQFWSAGWRGSIPNIFLHSDFKATEQNNKKVFGKIGYLKFLESTGNDYCFKLSKYMAKNCSFCSRIYSKLNSKSYTCKVIVE